jgi:hypothetical protein
MRRLVIAPALAALAFVAPSVSAGPGPQITDPANDANFANSQGQPILGDVPNNNAGPAQANQAYADVLSVHWKTTTAKKKVGRKTVTVVTGFTVTAVLSGAPKPPDGTIVVYRMLGTTPLCPFFGVAYYSTPLSDPTTPQTAIRDNCNGADTARLTKIANPAINGSTMTWTVPLSAIPKDTKVAAGTVLTGLYFTVTEIEDFKGQAVPTAVPIYGGATGLGVGVVDDSRPADAVYKIGS